MAIACELAYRPSGAAVAQGVGPCLREAAALRPREGGAGSGRAGALGEGCGGRGADVSDGFQLFSDDFLMIMVLFF